MEKNRIKKTSTIEVIEWKDRENITNLNINRLRKETDTETKMTRKTFNNITFTIPEAKTLLGKLKEKLKEMVKNDKTTSTKRKKN